jgi:hypothetical protein
LLYSHRLRSPNPWIWADLQACNGKSSWLCYFPAVEPSCPGETLRPGRIQAGTCGRYIQWPPTYEVSDFRAAATEFVFSSVSDIVVQEAERQLLAVFGDKGVPANLITVHVRWGDKVLEGSRKNNPIGRFTSCFVPKILWQKQRFGKQHTRRGKYTWTTSILNFSPFGKIVMLFTTFHHLSLWS